MMFREERNTSVYKGKPKQKEHGLLDGSYKEYYSQSITILKVDDIKILR